MTTSPVGPGPLAPATCPSHDSPPSPFPLSPLSPVASAKPAHRDAPVGHALDRAISHAGHGRMSSARLGPELGQAGETVQNLTIFERRFCMLQRSWDSWNQSWRHHVRQ